MGFFWHSRGADWEWEDGATRYERDGAGRVCVSLPPTHPHHAPTFTDFHVCSHIPMKSFHSLAPSSPLFCMLPPLNTEEREGLVPVIETAF